MECQRHLFQLAVDECYINGAYMSPLLRTAEAAGIEGMARKRNPSSFTPDDFFDDVETVKAKFGQIINAPPQQIAIIPAASYGLMNAIQNVTPKKGQHALTVFEEFPSGHFALSRWCTEHKAELKIIKPQTDKNRCQHWNTNILESINEDTALVMMSAIHWMDGTLFQLDKIGQRCQEVGATFIVDGSQSVGALPIDVNAFQIDALICAAYKWLLGPYSIGLAYYGPKYNNGVPIEESWMNRTNARQFSKLTNYDFNYRPGAQRYSVGEATNLIHMPMLEAGLAQLIDWGIPNIQSYCLELTRDLISSLTNLNFHLEDEQFRAHHLFGLIMPKGIDANKLMMRLKVKKIILSVRGNSIRISPNVYNTAEEINLLQSTIEEFIHEHRK